MNMECRINKQLVDMEEKNNHKFESINKKLILMDENNNQKFEIINNELHDMRKIINLTKEKIIQLTALYKQYESVVDDLQSSIFNYLNELNLELDLDFVTFERARKYIEDKGKL